ncbi:hypothetical protein ACROYT_G009817 [Oculina patagonica]
MALDNDHNDRTLLCQLTSSFTSRGNAGLRGQLNRSIPIKGIKFYVSSASWKMQRPTVSLLRSYEPFYGARLFVVLSSGKRKLLKLDFSPESGKVMSKKAEFISPEGEQITSVTVMLGCFGYEGYVTFTDLAVKPIYDSKLMKNQSIEPTQLLEPCQAPSRRPRQKSGDFLTEILYSASSPTDSDAITLVTQLTFNRINILKRNLRFWNVVIYGNEIGAQYPINRLRNIAIKNVKTQYVFMIDVDFVPSPDLAILARNQILVYNETRNSTDDKIAFVVPAFDGARHANSRDLPETKEELVKMVKRKNKLAPFRQIESPLSHSSTNYTKWYHTNESYEVSGYQDKYEPYLILRLTPELPLYDERFTGYGMNKISHVIELALLGQVSFSLDFSHIILLCMHYLHAAIQYPSQSPRPLPSVKGYKFIVLPNVWIVHRYHILSTLSFAHMTDPDRRFANRLQRFEFISDLYNKHKLGHCKKAKTR